MLPETRRDDSPWRARTRWMFLAFAFVGAFFLLAEHRAHVFPWLPWVFLAACPLMHFLMHHGYGFPLTIYLFSGWLSLRFPGVDWTSHDAGHLLEMMFGWRTNPHFGPFHLLSFVFIGAGFWLLSASWRVLYHSQRAHHLASSGPYARVRHPQYEGFVLIMFGFLVQWPTVVTLAMFPILVIMYVLLAKREERDAEAEFGDEYRRYAAVTPAFFPHWGSPAPSSR